MLGGAPTRLTVRRCGGLRRSPALALLLPSLAACATAPDDIDLDVPPVVATGAERVAEELEVVEIEYAGIRGGMITARMPGRPHEVVELLLDFDRADGHRAWASHHQTVSRTEAETVALWRFHGSLGIEPACTLVFRSARQGSAAVVEFEQLDTAFGLAAFFGDYRVIPLERDSLMVARVYIDSGLPFVNASAADIAAGLREDVRLLRTWLETR